MICLRKDFLKYKMIKFINKVNILFFTFEVLFYAVIISILIPFMKLPTLIAFIESKKRNNSCYNLSCNNSLSILDSISRFKFFVIHNNCLKKSLLIYCILLKSGIKEIAINIGIKRESGNLVGHSWIELNGSILFESQESVMQYTVIYTSRVE